MMEYFGWLFCEAAFRMWDIIPDREDGLLIRLPEPFYVLGCWCYKQGMRTS